MLGGAFPYPQRTQKTAHERYWPFWHSIAVIGLIRMGRGYAHSKMTLGCGGSHLRVYDVISRERRDKMACNHDIRESENSREQQFPTFPSQFIISFVEQYLLHIPYSVPHTLSLMIYLLTAHRSNDKYRKMRLDSLSHTSCTHDLRPSGNVTHNVTRNVINVASHSKDKLRHATNRASVARAATSMTLSTSRGDVVWPINP
jgi:hypothetical protein